MSVYESCSLALSVIFSFLTLLITIKLWKKSNEFEKFKIQNEMSGLIIAKNEALIVEITKLFENNYSELNQNFSRVFGNYAIILEESLSIEFKKIVEGKLNMYLQIFKKIKTYYLWAELFINCNKLNFFWENCEKKVDFKNSIKILDNFINFWQKSEIENYLKDLNLDFIDNLNYNLKKNASKYLWSNFNNFFYSKIDINVDYLDLLLYPKNIKGKKIEINIKKPPKKIKLEIKGIN